MVRFIAECLLQKVRKVRIDTSEPLNKAFEEIAEKAISSKAKGNSVPSSSINVIFSPYIFHVSLLCFNTFHIHLMNNLRPFVIGQLATSPHAFTIPYVSSITIISM